MNLIWDIIKDVPDEIIENTTYQDHEIIRIRIPMRIDKRNVYQTFNTYEVLDIFGSVIYSSISLTQTIDWIKNELRTVKDCD